VHIIEPPKNVWSRSTTKSGGEVIIESFSRLLADIGDGYSIPRVPLTISCLES
jgi:hypothetical protein